MSPLLCSLFNLSRCVLALTLTVSHGLIVSEAACVSQLIGHGFFLGKSDANVRPIANDILFTLIKSVPEN